jgi:hypothetical protein
MEFLRTNEIVIENEYCDIFPNQVSMEEISFIEIMEKKYESLNITTIDCVIFHCNNSTQIHLNGIHPIPTQMS